MAKGDKKKQQQAVDTSVNQSTAANQALTNQMIVPTTQNMYNNYNTASAQQMQDYRDLMDQYKNFSANAPGPMSFERVNYNRSPEMNEAFGGYRNFMQTGGFSDADIANMRARGISPIRAVYANMQNELDRQKNLQGGYSPNMAAAMTRMRGSTSQQIADMAEAVNARIAEQVQQGKMFGTSGMGNLSTTDAQLAQQAALANQRAGLETNNLNANSPYANQKLAALNAAANLYGTSPGMMGTTGNQLLGSTQNWLGANNQLGNIGQMRIGGQQAVSATPSNFETAFGRVGQGLGMAANIAGGFMGLPGGVQQPRLPGSRVNVPGMYGSYNPGQIYQNNPYG